MISMLYYLSDEYNMAAPQPDATPILYKAKYKSSLRADAVVGGLGPELH